MKRTEYNKVVSFLKKFYPRDTIQPETFKLWYDTVFLNMDYEVFLLRVADCIESEKYIPMPEFFCDNESCCFWLNNRHAMSKAMIERLENIKRLVG